MPDRSSDTAYRLFCLVQVSRAATSSNDSTNNDSKPQPHAMNSATATINNLASFLIINNNASSHTVHDLGVEFDSMITRETNLLGEVIRQDIDETTIAVLVEERLVCELGVFVG